MEKFLDYTKADARREVHPKENQNILFYEENDSRKPRRVSMGLIISDYILSKERVFQKQGMPFERCILGFMARFYGSYGVFENNEVDSLWEVLKFRIKEFQS